MVLRDDWFMRQIHEAADAVARAFDAAAAGRRDEALDDLDEGWASLLGGDRSLVEMVDPGTAVRLLRSPERVRAAVALYRAEAQIRASTGDAELGRALAQRALALLGIVRVEVPATDDAETEAALRALLVDADLVQ